ncbi:MAG: rRNA maturation RNase YbeY [Roseimicrobium sp.]
MPQPRIEIFPHHPTRQGEVARWRQLAERSCPLVLEELRHAAAPLATLEHIEVSLITDNAIAAIHGEFLDDPAPTDVITFHHGEILISLDTALRQAQDHAEAWEREVFRYIVHGLLHLAGWADYEDRERQAMHAVQERIVAHLWPVEPAVSAKDAEA